MRSVEAHAITPSNRLRSRLLASVGALGVNLHPDVVNVSGQRITKGCRALARARAVYLVRSTQYQFCDCGVRYHLHVDARLALNQLLGLEGNVAKKEKKAKKAKKTGKKKKK